jgi:hypothetical protein
MVIVEKLVEWRLAGETEVMDDIYSAFPQILLSSLLMDFDHILYFFDIKCCQEKFILIRIFSMYLTFLSLFLSPGILNLVSQKRPNT